MLGGKWRSIGSLGNIAQALLAGAKIYAEIKKGGDASLGHLGSELGKDFLEQSFLTGINRPMQAVQDPNRYGQDYLGNTVASIIPNFVGQIAKSQDGLVRENNSVGDYITNKIPEIPGASFLPNRKQNIEGRDVLGQTIPQEPTGIGAFVDLFNSKTPRSNPVIDELSRLNDVGNNATPSKMTKSQTIGGVKMSLTPEQLNILESDVGGRATSTLQTLFNNPNYQKLTDEDKAKAVDSVMSSLRKQVRATESFNGTITPSTTVAKVSNGNSGGLTGNYTLIDPYTGNVRQIDLSRPITEPVPTGDTIFDKLQTSKYNSAISSRVNDIYSLYQNGDLTKEQAIGAINDLTNQKVLKGKKPKKAGITIRKVTPKSFKFSTAKTKYPTLKLKGLKIKAPSLAQLTKTPKTLYSIRA